jgi:hypothetical protein
MSIGGVSSFAATPSRDVRAEFERMREIHSKNGPNGQQRRRVDGEDDGSPRPSAAAEALAGSSPDIKSGAAARKVDFSV